MGFTMIVLLVYLILFLIDIVAFIYGAKKKKWILFILITVVAYDMTSEEKQTQEFNSFRNIPDSFKKIVIVNGTTKPWRNEEGFVIMQAT